VIFLRKGEAVEHLYRAVARFKPVDLLIQAAAARGLLRCVDPDLQECAWARRLHCDGIRRPTHHDAVARLRDFPLQHSSRPLWVGRVDVQALHDSISHAAVRGALEAAATRAARRGEAIDGRDLRMVETLLASYSFGADVVVGARNILAARDPVGKVPWPLDELKAFHRNPLKARMGLPQGSPLSDVLANLVLDAVDRAVHGDGADSNLFCARYLDDLLIVHTRRKKCEAALKRAMDALRLLKLVPHQPRTYGVSKTAYWRAKSLAPLPWAPAGQGREWVGFLGYEVRFDGEVRIRKDTIERHKARMRKIVLRHGNDFDTQLRAQGSRGRKWFPSHAPQSVATVERELIRACIRRGRCWTGAFPLAAFGGEALKKQARDLDRYRRLLVARYRQHVEQQGQRLGLSLCRMRGTRDHYRRSYYFALVARFAPQVAVAPIAPSVSLVGPEGVR